MIRLNLLPPELGRPASSARARLAALPWNAIGLTAAGLWVLVTAGLLGAGALQARQLGRLTAEWEACVPDRLRTQKLEAELNALKNRQRAIENLKAPEARWAPRLALFSESLVANLWFQMMVFQMSRSWELREFLVDEFRDLVPGLEAMIPKLEDDEGPSSGSEGETAALNPDGTPITPPADAWKPRLYLRGAALVTSKDPGAPVRRFIERLKAHPDFGRWFTGLELKDVGHEARGPYEVSDFILILYPSGAGT